VTWIESSSSFLIKKYMILISKCCDFSNYIGFDFGSLTVHRGTKEKLSA